MLKKIKTSTLALFGGGIFFIILSSLFVTYAAQLATQKQLNEELSSTQSLYLKAIQVGKELSSKNDELQAQSIQLSPEVETAKSAINLSFEISKITGTLFSIASQANVKLVEVTSPSLSAQTLRNIDFSVLSMTVKVQGNFLDLVRFIIMLNQEFPSNAIESLQILEKDNMASFSFRMYNYSDVKNE